MITHLGIFHCLRTSIKVDKVLMYGNCWCDNYCCGDSEKNQKCVRSNLKHTIDQRCIGSLCIKFQY